jgi:hypothetical protein
MGEDLPEGEVIFEIQKLGDYQRVAAIHVASGLEVVVQAPAGAAYADVRALALRKLERAMKAEQGDDPPPAPPRPGKWV